MTPERARELAIAILFGMVGNNDEIANDPARWGDPLQSFSFDEVAVKIEEAILQACAEEREAAAKIAENEGCDQTEYRCGTIERIAAAIRGGA